MFVLYFKMGETRRGFEIYKMVEEKDRTKNENCAE